MWSVRLWHACVCVCLGFVVSFVVVVVVVVVVGCAVPNAVGARACFSALLGS